MIETMKIIKLILFISIGCFFFACQNGGNTTDKKVEKKKSTQESWQQKIEFDNYLLSDVDSIDALIRNERFGFDLFMHFQKNDSLSFYKQFISFKEQHTVYGHSHSENYILSYNDKIETKRHDCFQKLRMMAYDKQQLNWSKAKIEKVVYDLFDAENDRLFLKVVVKVNDGNGNIYELTAPDCVYVNGRLKIVQPIQWQGISCWMML